MKKFGSLVFVSLLSGVLTLGAYKFFLEPNKAGKLTLASPNYAKNVNLGAENIDFTTAAEKKVRSLYNSTIFFPRINCSVFRFSMPSSYYH